MQLLGHNKLPNLLLAEDRDPLFQPKTPPLPKERFHPHSPGTTWGESREQGSQPKRELRLEDFAPKHTETARRERLGEVSATV